MNLFAYPDYPNNAPKWLADFNRRVAKKSFHSGTFGLAFDVFRDQGCLFSSYTAEQGESIDDFCRRSYPDIEHPDFANCGMGAGQRVKGIDRFPVPTWAAIDHTLSLSEIRRILAAALAVSVYPRPCPIPPSRVPTSNALRQRFHNADRDWIRININWSEEDVVLRAVVAKSTYVEPTQSEAVYDVSLYQRESGLKKTLEPKWGEVTAPFGDMRDPEQRRPVLQQAKKLVDATGYPARIVDASEHGFVLHLDSEPFALGVNRTERIDFEPPKNRTEGFSM